MPTLFDLICYRAILNEVPKLCCDHFLTVILNPFEPLTFSLVASHLVSTLGMRIAVPGLVSL
jgi:hypothetical protein